MDSKLNLIVNKITIYKNLAKLGYKIDNAFVSDLMSEMHKIENEYLNVMIGLESTQEDC